MAQKKAAAIVVKNLCKTFRIPTEQSSGIKQVVINYFRGVKGYRDFSPLKDVSFTIEEGDFFGIVGRNGSGKSTLLKLLAGIYEPNRGSIKVNGTLVPFIELGVGFNPELTGRENVFLNGALLGFSHGQMAAMYDDIVEFAELHDFMDERLKNYSSGMQVRLAFSIAIRADGDILLLDEVLAVGDEAFQKKCFAYFDMLRRKKKTVILVTHDMGAVQRFCTKAMFIKEGNVEYIGSPDKVATLYTKQNDEMYAKSTEKEAGKLETKSKLTLEVLNGVGGRVKRFKEKEVLELRLSWPYDTAQYAGVALINGVGHDVFSPNSYQDKYPAIKGNSLVYSLHLDIVPGEYYFKAAVFGEHDNEVIDRELEGPKIIVEKSPTVPRYVGSVNLQHSWRAE